MKPQLLIIPGLGNSGNDHWQTYWESQFPGSLRIQQDDWDEPQLKDWLHKLNATINTLDKPTILVAHSLAVSLVLHWTKNNTNPFIVGALLVAPADVDSEEHTPNKVRNFSPMPLHKLPFPSTVVASENDPYASLERKSFFANSWASDFVNIGHKGHINSESDLKYWEEGQKILEDLVLKITN